MTMKLSYLSALSDEELLAELKVLAARERHATAQLIASLAEVDARRLYLGEGCSSLFAYCTQVLRLSEHAAYGRIEAARTARRFAIVLDLIADGSITLTTVCLLAPHLTNENHRWVLDSARHKSKRDVEVIVAGLRPQPVIPSTVRKLPSPPQPQLTVVEDDWPPSPIPLPSVARTRPAVVAPLAPERYKVQFTMSSEMHDRFRLAQDLLRHVVPNGDPAAIFDRALTLLVKQLEYAAHAASSRPHSRDSTPSPSRRVPAQVKRAVWTRDGGAFVGTGGRCTERGFLEYHHVVPYAAGGQTCADNLELRCRAHNQYEAELYFGPMMVRETRATWAVGTRSGPG
jgi:hypothetical protein